MPQMSPLMWVLLSFFFVFFYFICFMTIYFKFNWQNCESAGGEINTKFKFSL